MGGGDSNPRFQLDSAFQLTEHLKALYYYHTHPSDSNTTVPVTPTLARQLSQPPPNTSREIWLYELGRFLIQKTNAIIVALFADQPPCSPATCPEMRASEWQYLCAVHDPPKSCSAIDYCCHTLDWAASSLTSSKMFPSRMKLGSGNVSGGSDKMLQQQMKEITNIFRRVYRIYAHAWFQHREMFWRVEGKTGLYVLFKTVCDEYSLIQPENYTIPQEAEGVEPETLAAEEKDKAPVVPTLLRREPDGLPDTDEDAANAGLSRADTTKRHRHTRSDMSSSVSTVIQEEAEEDDDQSSKPGLTMPTTLSNEPADESRADANADGQDDAGPVPSFARSDTLKPQISAGTDDPVDETVVAPEPESNEDEPTREAGEVAEPSTAPAADAEEAGKSVGD